ncbi:MAG: autotransporter-associated beta strand repeat-containing protein [Pirellulales bacterium]|nr:autotransporter-associated beta strand repeat-containing protein [Pirellulales bacterium]
MRQLLLVVPFLLLASLMLAVPAGAETYTWILDSGSGYVNVPENWSPAVVPGNDSVNDYVYIEGPGELLIDADHLFAGRIYELYVGTDTCGGTVTQSGGTVTVRRFDIGRNLAGNTTSTYNLTGGVINEYTNSYNTFGGDGSHGVFNMSGGTEESPTSLNFLDGNQFRVGYGDGGSGVFTMSGHSTANLGKFMRLAYGTDVTGTMTMSGDSYAEIVQVGSDASYIGRGAGCTGLLNMSGNAEALFDPGGIFFIASSGSNSNRASGTVSLGGNASLTILGQVNVCHNDYNTGTINVTGSAEYSSGTVFIGVSGATSVAELNVSTGVELGATGGKFTTTGALAIGRDLSQGTVNLSETGTITVGTYVRFGDSGGTAILNLNGGTLECDEILTEDGDETKGTTNATLHFNGGVLKATGSNDNFIHAHETYTNQILNVKAGGAIIESNSFDVGIPVAMTEDANSPNGGLTKRGDGILTLGGANTYTGDTSVQAGGLSVTGSITSDVTVDAAAVLMGTGTIEGNVAMAAESELAPGASVGTLTVTGDLTVGGTLDIEYDSDAETIDLLAVSGTLDLDGATISFSDLGTGTLESTALIFATYGTLTGTPLPPVNVPMGYTVNYAYGGNNVALVAVPEPSVIALLLGLGLTLAALRFRR